MISFVVRNGLHWQTIVFNVLCLSQLAHALAIRSENQSLFSIGIFSNKPLIGSVILSLMLQFCITYIPFLQPIFKTESLTLNEFLGVGAASSIVFFAVEIEKGISRRKGKIKLSYELKIYPVLSLSIMAKTLSPSTNTVQPTHQGRHICKAHNADTPKPTLQKSLSCSYTSGTHPK